MAVFVVSLAYLALTAVLQGRPMFPRFHDEMAYLLQARMLTAGKLWLAPHAFPEFFDTFYVLQKPVYAVQYFPGAALMYALGVLTGLSSVVMPLMLAAACVALAIRVAGEVAGRTPGLIAGLCVLANRNLRIQSTLAQAQVPALLLALIAAWAFLRWRRKLEARWAVVGGAALGWLAITRPLDGVACALPLLVAMAYTCVLGTRGVDLSEGNSGRVLPRIGKTFALGCAGALPFLLLQLAFNVGVTGSALRTPFAAYADRDLPGLELSLHPTVPDRRPESSLPQKQLSFEQWRRAVAERAEGGPVPALTKLIPQQIVLGGLPHPVLLVVLLPGLVLLRGPARWTIVGFALLQPLLYLLYPLYLIHYVVPLLGGFAVLVALGARAVSEAFGARAGAVAALLTVGVCLATLPEATHSLDDPDRSAGAELKVLQEKLKALPTSAVVFATYSPGVNFQQEPVYNLAAAGIDDNLIVLAHDLGQHNDSLMNYYRKSQPSRKFYRFDRATGTLTPIE